MSETGFWLKGAKGKLAGTVMYTTGGRTIQRQIVSPKNPQSDNQMRQRAVFAGASKFYQNAQQNRFVLAFQNKKGNQSEFNAFMQKNLREFDTLPFPTKEQANTPEFCNFFPWICTEGNLQSIPAAFPDDDIQCLCAAIKITSDNDAYVTSWEELIAANPSLNLQYGDIITVTVVISDMSYNDSTTDVVIGSVAPRWFTRQIIVGADIEGYTLMEYFLLNGFSDYTAKDLGTCLSVNVTQMCVETGIINDGDDFNVTETPAMICVTRSRQEGSQLKVSTSRFELDDMAQRIYERLSNDSAMRDAIASYRKTANSVSMPTNILQGSVAEGIAVNSIRYTPSGATAETTVAAPASGLSVKVSTATSKDSATVLIYGAEDVVASKVSGAAVGYTVSTAKATVILGIKEGSHGFKTVEGRKITFTRNSSTADSIAFQIKYAGVVVAAGNLVKS